MAEHMHILKNNQNTHYSLIFQDKAQALCSATSIEGSHRDFHTYMAERRSILKNKQNAYTVRLLV